MKLEKLICAALVAALLAGALPTRALAERPPGSPDHGWRRLHDRYYVGYDGHKWPYDYGVLHGSCDRAEVGSVLRSTAGGAVGPTNEEDDSRAMATVIGAVVGADAGRELDEGDRACFGISLELAKSAAAVRWTNENAHTQYVLTPKESFDVAGHSCRDFTLRVIHKKIERTIEGGACRANNGVWRVD